MRLPGNRAFPVILTSQEMLLHGNCEFREICLPRKFDNPWNVISPCYFASKYDFPEKYELPGNRIPWKLDFKGNVNSGKMWLPGICDSREMILPEKYDFPGKVSSDKISFPDKVNYWELWLPWFKWQVRYYADICIIGYKYMWHLWLVWPKVTIVTKNDKCGHMWHVWLYVTRCSTHTGHLSNLAAGPLGAILIWRPHWGGRGVVTNKSDRLRECMTTGGEGPKWQKFCGRHFKYCPLDEFHLVKLRVPPWCHFPFWQEMTLRLGDSQFNNISAHEVRLHVIIRFHAQGNSIQNQTFIQNWLGSKEICDLMDRWLRCMILHFYRGRQKGFGQVVWMLQASSDRSGKQQH